MNARRVNRTVPRAVGDMARPGARDPGRSALLGTCQHIQEYRPPPKVGDMVFCRKCHEYRPVLLLQSEHRAKCRSCNYSRQFGRAMWAADKAARKHGDAKGHTVDRYDGTTLQWTYSPGGPEQLSIDNVNDDPPY